MTEALYVLRFGDVSGPNSGNGGVVVLETNRVFGGDSGHYYLGSYAVKDGKVTATVDVTNHDPRVQNVFMDNAKTFKLELVGQVQGRNIVGQMKRFGTQINLPIRLEWMAALPG